MFDFKDWFFLFLTPLPFFLYFFKKRESFLPFSSVSLLKVSKVKKTNKDLYSKLLILAGLAFVFIALARPQKADSKINSSKPGIDIILALDVSGSMKLEDFKPNRLEVAKNVIKHFIKKRINDRIGLVIFAGVSYTKIPLTTDYFVLLKILSNISTEDVSKDGTAIGMGIASSINRLRKSKSKSKIIILLTDGANNQGIISPLESSKLAKELNIKIYAVGIGNLNLPYNQRSNVLNESLLKRISFLTGGKYFRADSESSLDEIFTIINRLEKSNLDIHDFYSYEELFYIYLIIALILISLGVFFSQIIYIRIP